MRARFTVGSVTGYPISASGQTSAKPRTLWYVFDAAPPRLSHFAGFGDKGQQLAQQMAEQLNREFA